MFEKKVKAKKGDDVFHFIAYVPVKGKLYELDGLQEGPNLIGDCGPDWVLTAKK